MYHPENQQKKSGLFFNKNEYKQTYAYRFLSVKNPVSYVKDNKNNSSFYSSMACNGSFSSGMFFLALALAPSLISLLAAPTTLRRPSFNLSAALV